MAKEIEVRGPIEDEAAAQQVIQQITGDDRQIDPVAQTAVFFGYEGASIVVRWSEGNESFEFIYKKKRDQESGLSVREEITTWIPKGQAESFLEIMSRMGLEEGLVSPAKRIEFAHNRIEWSFKLDTQIGNYWEAEATGKFMQDFDDEEQILAELRSVASRLGLEVWTERRLLRRVSVSAAALSNTNTPRSGSFTSWLKLGQSAVRSSFASS